MNTSTALLNTSVTVPRLAISLPAAPEARSAPHSIMTVRARPLICRARQTACALLSDTRQCGGPDVTSHEHPQVSRSPTDAQTGRQSLLLEVNKATPRGYGSLPMTLSVPGE